MGTRRIRLDGESLMPTPVITSVALSGAEWNITIPACTFKNTSPAQKVCVIRQPASPTVNTFEIQNSANTALVTVDKDGRLGIGNSAPTVKLDVTGAITASGIITGSSFVGAAFSSGSAGLAPASGGGTTNFLRADGTWAAPGGGGSGPDVQTITTATTVTPTFPNNLVDITALTTSLSVGAPTGTYTNGFQYMICMKSASAQTITWNATYQSGGVFDLLNVTTPGKFMTFRVMYSSSQGKHIVYPAEIQP